MMENCSMTCDTMGTSVQPMVAWLPCAGADPGFLLGGDASVRNGVTDFFCRIPRVISGGGGGGVSVVHPLHAPPRSAPVVICLLVH